MRPGPVPRNSRSWLAANGREDADRLGSKVLAKVHMQNIRNRIRGFAQALVHCKPGRKRGRFQRIPQLTLIPAQRYHHMVSDSIRLTTEKPHFGQEARRSCNL